MYATTNHTTHHRTSIHPRARRVGTAPLTVRRPPRRVDTWRRTVRNLVIGAAVLGLLLAVFSTHALGQTTVQARTIVVQPGQTVWSIAQARYPDQDPRQVVQEIDGQNHLQGGTIYPGERLRLPAA